MKVSNCCQHETENEDIDICPACLDHCAFVDEEDMEQERLDYEQEKKDEIEYHKFLDTQIRH